jgi:hypothetical protein
MKRCFVLLMLLSLAALGFAQNGFELEGTVGTAYNDQNQVYSMQLDGRMQWNDYFSTGIGLSLWNSGYKDSWLESTSVNTSTFFRLSDNQTIPGIQLSLRGQYPLFKVWNHPVHLFVEPRLYFLPFSARTVFLNETYLNKIMDGENETYIERATDPTYKTIFKSACFPRFFWGLQGGFLINLKENIDLALSYGYTNMDLFKDLRNRSIQGHENLVDYPLNAYFPKKDLFLLNVGFIYKFPFDR